MRHVRPCAREGEARAISASRQAHARGARPRRAPVTHANAALVLCTAGRSRVEQQGEWDLRAGEVLLVPAGAPHRTLEAVEPAAWALGFSPTSLVADGGASLLEPFERVRRGGSAVVAIPPARQAHLEGLLAELARVGDQARREASSDAVERALLTLILAEVDRAARAGAAPALVGGVVGEALRFIERSCLGRLTLEDVAAAVGRSPAHVTAALTKATGRSAGAWITSGRMAEARRLLLHTDERIDRVAGRVGYADATHFIRMFRREHGATPAAWRAAERAPRE